MDKFMAKVLGHAIKVVKTATVSYREDRSDKTSRMIKETVFDAVLSADFQGPGLTTIYTRMGNLKYWGLTRQDPRWWHQGVYQLTDAAHAFVTGKLVLPRILTIKGGKAITASTETISFREACKTYWPEIADHIQRWRSLPTNPQPELF